MIVCNNYIDNSITAISNRITTFFDKAGTYKTLFIEKHNRYN